jgi:glycosyltransferase involved in cell wall biosynthesis
MRMGVPIIASDIPSVREVMGDAGVLVPCGDAGAIARAVRGVLDCPETAGGLRERARARSARFTLEGMVDAYEAELR